MGSLSLVLDGTLSAIAVAAEHEIVLAIVGRSGDPEHPPSDSISSTKKAAATLEPR